MVAESLPVLISIALTLKYDKLQDACCPINCLQRRMDNIQPLE